MVFRQLRQVRWLCTAVLWGALGAVVGALSALHTYRHLCDALCCWPELQAVLIRVSEIRIAKVEKCKRLRPQISRARLDFTSPTPDCLCTKHTDLNWACCTAPKCDTRSKCCAGCECCRKCFHSISTRQLLPSSLYFHIITKSVANDEATRRCQSSVRARQIRQRCMFAITMLILTRFENNKLAHTPTRDAMQKRMLHMRETVWERQTKRGGKWEKRWRDSHNADESC